MARSVIKKGARLISGPLNPRDVYHLIYIHGVHAADRGERDHRGNRDLLWKVAAIWSASCLYMFMEGCRDFKCSMRRQSSKYRYFASSPTLSRGPRGFSPPPPGEGDTGGRQVTRAITTTTNEAKSKEGKRKGDAYPVAVANPALRREDTAKTRRPTPTPRPTPMRKCAVSKAQRGRAKNIAAELAAETDIPRPRALARDFFRPAHVAAAPLNSVGEITIGAESAKHRVSQ